jgi:hypothetical protein
MLYLINCFHRRAVDQTPVAQQAFICSTQHLCLGLHDPSEHHVCEILAMDFLGESRVCTLRLQMYYNNLIIAGLSLTEDMHVMSTVAIHQ